MFPNAVTGDEVEVVYLILFGLTEEMSCKKQNKTMVSKLLESEPSNPLWQSTKDAPLLSDPDPKIERTHQFLQVLNSVNYCTINSWLILFIVFLIQNCTGHSNVQCFVY